MQRDFHYNVIRVLAEKAGFVPEEAQIIAYASQYIDDAIEHKPIKLPLTSSPYFQRIKGKILDPTCTAYSGMRFVEGFKKSSQMKVFLSYHFLPPEKYTGQKNYTYVTKHNSKFSKLLLEQIENNFKTNDDRIYNLISLGIAIHTYSDTWAHENFSGTHSNYDNNIAFIRFYNQSKWFPLSHTGKLKSKILPSIGHAEAGNFPDLPYLVWKFMKIKDQTFYIKNNLDIYIDAAYNIFNYLKTFTNSSKKWETFSGKLINCLSYVNDSLNQRCNNYSANFHEIGFYYNKNRWKNNLLFPQKYESNSYEISQPKSDIKWILFHKAAYEQRKFVMSNIKKL